mmetsp:Transcript_9932/g.12362  ORF Transcript_9932/g.12362 Transcript_9932/m.12362 type:complete len:277 (-) Transcript_9932:427-1257(-)
MEELLDAVIRVFVLHVAPVRHIELLVDGEAPLIREVANTARIALSAHVLAVERVALRLLVEQFLRAHGFPIDLGSNHTLAIAIGRVAQGAAAQDIHEVLLGCASLKDDFAPLVWVGRCAAVRPFDFFVIEQDLAGLRALGLIVAKFESESALAVLAVLSVVVKLGLARPAELSPYFLRVELHAAARIRYFVLLGREPAVVGDRALEVFIADVTILAIGHAFGLVGPLSRVVAVGALDAVFVLVARLVHLVAHAHLAAVARLTLGGHRARAARIHLF